MDFNEIVTLRVRTGHDEEFMYDSRPFIVSSKKGLKVTRFIALKALDQTALEWDPSNGLVINAKVYIEDDIESPRATPSAPLKAEDIVAFKNTDGLGDDTILIDGKPVKKRTIDFRNKYEKKDFSENNTI